MSIGIFEENEYKLMWSFYQHLLTPAEASLEARKLLEKLNPGESDRLLKTANGKPYLKDSSFKLSISHASKMVAVALAPFDIGLDVEAPEARLLRVKDRVFRPEECEWAGKDLHRLATIWTAREALYKLDGGRGLDFRREMWTDCPTEGDFPLRAWLARKEEKPESAQLAYHVHLGHVFCIAFRR